MAGELKHGPISLVEDGTLVVAVLTQDVLVPKMISNMQGGNYTRRICNGDNEYGAYGSGKERTVCAVYSEDMQIFYLLPCHYSAAAFAYYISLGKGLDVDKPRNLAKSVTVE